MAKPRDIPADVPSGRAISIKQPYVEEILRGIKKFEYRSMQTHIRGRVYLYASKRPGDSDRFKKLKKEPGELPTGVIVGSVEIADCKKLGHRDYAYKLKNPRRYRKMFKPKKRAQPCWFFPY